MKEPIIITLTDLNIEDLNTHSNGIVEKEWGREIWIHNDDDYCGKILQIRKHCMFSMHYHRMKKETWYITKGNLTLLWIDTRSGEKHEESLKAGLIIEMHRDVPHQIVAGNEDVELFEVSSRHYEEDSYRVWRGLK